MIEVLRSLLYLKRYWQLTLLAFFSLVSATVLSLSVPQILRNVIDQGLPQGAIVPSLATNNLAQSLQFRQAHSQLIASRRATGEPGAMALLQATAHRCDSLGVEAEPVHSSDVAGMLDLEAGIHDH